MPRTPWPGLLKEGLNKVLIDALVRGFGGVTGARMHAEWRGLIWIRQSHTGSMESLRDFMVNQ
jgi:hypothetical protein